MPDDLENRLRKIEELVEDNNRMIKKLRRAQIWGRVWQTVKWLIIIVAALLGYYFAQPYIKIFSEAWQKIQETTGNISDSLGQ